jgi:hypothetical protein
MHRLGDEQLETRAVLIRDTLARPDVEGCATAARGLPVPSEIGAPMFERLGPELQEAWIDLLAEAAAAELASVKPPPADQAGGAAALQAVADGLPQEEQAPFKRVLGFPIMASENDLCWATRALYAELPKLGAGERRVLLRVMIQP